MSTIVGRQIDHYKIEKHIARGGMADVYLALDVSLQRPVALKIMLPGLVSDPALLARFEREAQTIAQLNHANIIQIYTIGKVPEALIPSAPPYLAMQYIEGGSLHEWLNDLAAAGRPVSTKEALAIARQIAAALNAAHQAGIVHRDLKPANILMRADTTPIITDLGIAAVLTRSTRLTQTGAVMGTPYYMAPEQISGQPVDGRTDIYALGVILFEMLTGKTPFNADSPLAVLHQHLHEPPPDLGTLNSQLTLHTRKVVDTCLRKEPDARYATAAQLGQVLDFALRHEQGDATAPPVPAGPTTSAGFKIPRWLWVAAPLLLLVLAAGAFWLRGRAADPTLLANPPAVAAETAVPQNVAANTNETATVAPIIDPTEPATAVPTSTFAPPPTTTNTAVPTNTPAPTNTPIPTVPPLPVPANVPPTGRIVYTCYIDDVDDLCAINPDGSGETRLTAVAATDFYATYTPDGQQILFSSRRDGAFFLYAMPAGGGTPQRQEPTNVGGIYAPERSPDGRQVAFTAASSGQQHIWVADSNGANPRQLTFEGTNNVDPTWSPDGTEIAYASDTTGDFQHFIVNLQTGESRLIATDVEAQGGRSDWSPDGRWLAIYAGPRTDRDIYLIAIDGSVTYQLTDGGSNLAPSFSPDGNWLTFTSYRSGGDGEIYIMRTDGSDVRQVTNNSHTDYQPRWGP